MAYYFASDTHIGLTLDGRPVESERRLMAWLEKIEKDADAVFLLGDIFDFWYEYKRVVPKGFVRLLGRLAEMTDRGMQIHFFPGNHDMWIRDYFERECGLIVHREGLSTELYGKRIYMAHGDAVGYGGAKVASMQRVFRSRTARRLFSALVHPDAALKFGQGWSQGSRARKNIAHAFRGEEEGVVKFAREYLAAEDPDVDYFVFGHLHCPAEYPLTERSTLYVLGEWTSDGYPVYGMLTPQGFSLEKFVP